MKKTFILLLCLGCVTVVFPGHADDFKQSKVTQVVNEVQIISAADQAKKNAVVNDLFFIPDILRTGPSSRAELVAQDETVTRVGANTIFSFDPASRTIDLKQGSLLFHSPHGKGGGSIHTGSATASVLGSTLIVTTTPKGGFKVICLEDTTEIKLPNGLHQRLKPGQMTYLLPGGNQLAPIVLFRLDDLTMNSLLVKGFINPLPSMPLILIEIDKQTKLLKSGKATDTGLLAGDNATSSQVEVLDANTIQSSVNPYKFPYKPNPIPQNTPKALEVDATINQPSLTDAAIPSPPSRILINPGFLLAGNNFFAGRKFQGFGAKDIFLNPPAAGLDLLTIDLSTFTAGPEFDFVAAKNLNIQGSTTFDGLSADNNLFLVAGNQITFSPNTILKANAGNLELTAPGPMTLDAVTIMNTAETVGNVTLVSGSTINLKNNSLIIAGSAGLITSGRSISPKVGHADASRVTIDSHGLLTVKDTSIQAHFLTLNSGDSILLDANGKHLVAVGSSGVANFTAPNLVTVNNADFSAYTVVNMAAHTITINGVTFGANSIDNFGTQTGQVNVNGTQTPGGLNMYNSYYGSTAITSASQIHVSSGPGSTPGMYSYANPSR